MTTVKGRTCHAHFRGRDGKGTCDTDCQWYTGAGPCPMLIPRELWDNDICKHCQRKYQTCCNEPSLAREDQRAIACYGFVELKDDAETMTQQQLAKAAQHDKAKRRDLAILKSTTRRLLRRGVPADKIWSDVRETIILEQAAINRKKKEVK